jgi:hypothetical protein
MSVRQRFALGIGMCISCSFAANFAEAQESDERRHRRTLNRTEGSNAPIRFADPLLINFDHAVDFVASPDLNGDGRYDLLAAWCAGREEPCGAVSLLNTRTPEGGIAFTRQLVPLPV